MANSLDISSMSYTNKDFESIYSELLTLAKNISDRFDPTESNESDPFVVLLKLLAFVGDKINYNVDKNILERFTSSATQYNSVHELTAMLGYNMEYYNSAETTAVFKYTNLSKATKSIIIPKFSKLSTNDTNPIDFVTTEVVEFSSVEAGESAQKVVPVIQGTLTTLKVLDSETITLANLDDNNRIYFSEKAVAQNGVFITGGTFDETTSTIWTRVQNLNTAAYKSASYLFNYDSIKQLPYIQFPEWINQIIGSGLKIEYLITQGSSGNIKVKTLTKLSSTITLNEEDASDQNYSLDVYNSYATVNGRDPEEIEEAVKNAAKTLGTFDTLVTCRDFANYIYTNVLDNSDNYTVSNIQVSDRRTDINDAYSYVTYLLDYGQQIKNALAANGKIATAYDLMLYPLKYVKDVSFNETLNQTNYDKSFKNCSDAVVQDIIIPRIDSTKNSESPACITHDYKSPTLTTGSADIVAIKNYYKLDALVTTYSAMTASEQASILININNALAQRYQARNVEYGEALNEEEIREVIQQADTRIKYVSLRIPSITPKVLFGDDIERETTSVTTEGGYKTNAWMRLLISKNIYSGKVSAFEYDERFNYEYCESAAAGDKWTSGVVENIKCVTTEAHFRITGDKDDIPQNTMLQFISDEYATKLIYTYGVNYSATGLSLEGIPANATYVLKSNEAVIIQYTDSTTGESIGIKYKAGDILRPNFKIENINDSTATVKDKKYRLINDGTEYTQNFNQISTSGQIEILDKALSQDFKSGKYCYWSLKNKDNKFNFIKNLNCYILDEGEYFFVTNQDFSELYTFNSGFKITQTGNVGLEDKICERITDLSSIYLGGLDSIRDKFSYFYFNNENYLSMTSQEIITLVENDCVKMDTSPYSMSDNVFKSFDSYKDMTYYLKLSSSVTAEKKLAEKPSGWMERALLNINCGPDLPQKLDPGQKMTFTYDDAGTEKTFTLTGNASNSNKLKLNNYSQKTGGIDIDLSYTDLLKGSDILYPAFYGYSRNDSFYSSAGYSMSALDENYFDIRLAKGQTSITLNKAIANKPLYFMVFITDEADQKLEIYYDAAKVTLTQIIPISASNAAITLKKGLSIFKAQGTASDQSVTIRKINATDHSNPYRFVLSRPRYVNGTNTLLDAYPASAETDIIEMLKANDKSTDKKVFNHFNLINFQDPDKAIDLNDSYKLTSAEAFFDYNNIANQWTLPEIDFKNSLITVTYKR